MTDPVVMLVSFFPSGAAGGGPGPDAGCAPASCLRGRWSPRSPRREIGDHMNVPVLAPGACRRGRAVRTRGHEPCRCPRWRSAWALSWLPGRPVIGRRCLRDRPAARNLLAGVGHTQWPDGGKKLVKKALMLAFALAACLQMAPVSAAQAAASAVGSTLCLKDQHLIVHSRFGARYQI